LHIIIIDFFGSEEDVDISQFDLTWNKSSLTKLNFFF
jgi:hypothetical protein